MLSRRTVAMQRVANTLQQSLVDFQDKCFAELNNNQLSKSPTKTSHHDLKCNGIAPEDNSESQCTSKDNSKSQSTLNNFLSPNDVHAFDDGHIKTLTNQSCTDSALTTKTDHSIIPSNQNGHQAVSANQDGHQTVSADGHQSLTGKYELSTPNKPARYKDNSYNDNTNTDVATPGLALIMFSGFDTDDDDE